MSEIIQQYANINNGGQERFIRDGDKFFVSSDWGQGFCKAQQVSRAQAQRCLAHSNAPADVVLAILGEVG